MIAGHGPFSHVFEHLLIKDLEKTHEDITSWIIEKSEVGDKLSKMGYNPKEVAGLQLENCINQTKHFLTK